MQKACQVKVHLNIMWTADIRMKWRCDHRIFICFIPFTGTVNSKNWPAPNVWVFIAQLVEHCSANAEAMSLNPVEALKTFLGLTLQLLKSQSQLWWSHLHFMKVHCWHFLRRHLNHEHLVACLTFLNNLWALTRHCSEINNIIKMMISTCFYACNLKIS